VPSLLLLVERALSAAGRAQDEAAKLEADLEERHARELTALEARGDETDECKPGEWQPNPVARGRACSASG